MALNLHHELSDPTDHGWVNVGNGHLGIHWTECKPVLEVTLGFVTCIAPNKNCFWKTVLIYLWIFIEI